MIITWNMTLVQVAQVLRAGIRAKRAAYSQRHLQNYVTCNVFPPDSVRVRILILNSQAYFSSIISYKISITVKVWENAAFQTDTSRVCTGTGIEVYLMSAKGGFPLQQSIKLRW